MSWVVWLVCRTCSRCVIITHTRTRKHTHTHTYRYANRVKISPSRSYVAVPLETSHGGGFAIVNVTNVHDMNIEYILRSGVGSGVNDTVYALEWVDSNNLYVAATDGILRVYSLR